MDLEKLDIKFLWFNAENLFLLSDQVLKADHLKLDEIQWQKLSTSISENKSLAKTKSIAKIILDKSPDVVALCEVGGFESLKNFGTLFLKDLYSPALIESNSNRNIDIGFLIKKGSPFYFDVASNRNRPINFLYPHERENLDVMAIGKDGKPASHKFSRDVSELHLFQQNREKPFLIVLAAHLKSRLDPEGIDPHGFERRQAELRTLLEIYRELEEKFHQEVPIIVTGDFNGNASCVETDSEFQMIYTSTGLQDIGELAQLSAEKRATYYQVNRNSKTEARQLDYCFLSPIAKTLLKSPSVDFYRYKDHLGQIIDPPNNLDAKLNLPSDHYPIYFELTDVPLRPSKA
jgi:endonuclease/exonuclease/phosphatase family metal-dependent hydrolase